MRDGSGYILVLLLVLKPFKTDSAHRNTAIGYHALKANTSAAQTLLLVIQYLDANTTRR